MSTNAALPLSALRQTILRALPGPRGIGMDLPALVFAVRSNGPPNSHEPTELEVVRHLTTLIVAGLIAWDATTDRWARTEEGDAALGVQAQEKPTVPMMIARAFGALNEAIVDLGIPASRRYYALLVPASPDEPVLASGNGQLVDLSLVDPVELIHGALKEREDASDAGLEGEFSEPELPPIANGTAFGWVADGSGPWVVTERRQKTGHYRLESAKGARYAAGENLRDPERWVPWVDACAVSIVIDGAAVGRVVIPRDALAKVVSEISSTQESECLPGGKATLS
jgi:hypothetical protein